MVMRETLGSLKAYFWIVGLLTVGANLGVLDKPSGGVLPRLLGTLGIALGCCFVYLGASLRKLMMPAPTPVYSILAASCVLVAVNMAMALIRNPPGAVLPFIGLLVNWYLFVNVRRLAKAASPLGGG
jgi:hypothetical protein